MKAALHPALKATAESLKPIMIFLILLVAFLVVIYMVAWGYNAVFGTLSGNA